MNKKTETQANDASVEGYLTELGDRVREVREERELNVVRVCFMSGLSVNTVQNMEKGRAPAYNSLWKLIQGFEEIPDNILPPDRHEILPLEGQASDEELQVCLSLSKIFEKNRESLLEILSEVERVKTDHTLNEGKKVPPDKRQPVLVELGERIRDIRLARGLSGADLAAASGLHAPAIHLIEIGMRNPNLDTLLKIAAALRVPTALLFAGFPKVDANFALFRVRGLYNGILSTSEQARILFDKLDALQRVTKDIVN